MKTYVINYEENVRHRFYVEANSVQEAETKFFKMCDNGQIDFSDGWVTDSEVDVEEYIKEAN